MKKDPELPGDNQTYVAEPADKALFDHIIHNSRSMISIINRNYVYERVNDTFCSEHQIDSASVVGKSLDEVWGREVFQRNIKERIDSCFEGETVRYEASFITPRLGQRFYEVVFRPLFTGNNGITHLIAETFDINDLRLSRIEVMARQEELRKFEIFARGIAHDFNNILATISGYSEMLREDVPAGSSMSENSERIHNAVRKAQSVVEKLLKFNKDEENVTSFTDVAEVLNETIAFIRSTIPAGVEIRSNISGRGAEVIADPVQLFRVFLNILNNAMQAMETTGGRLTVEMSVADFKDLRSSAKAKGMSGKYVTLTFRDTGVGIDKSNIGRIFEPYVSVRQGGNGTGLGLPVIQDILRKMHGEARISSRKGKGSVFYVYLPLAVHM
jgi:signal transduction histidine kinase